MNSWIDNTINTIKAGFISTIQAGGKKNKVKKILSTNRRKSQKVTPLLLNKQKNKTK